jgi:hypothetical protein
VASSKPGPFQEFYTALLTKGIRPEMARLTLAREIEPISLSLNRRVAAEATEKNFANHRTSF